MFAAELEGVEGALGRGHEPAEPLSNTLDVVGVDVGGRTDALFADRQISPIAPRRGCRTAGSREPATGPSPMSTTPIPRTSRRIWRKLPIARASSHMTTTSTSPSGASGHTSPGRNARLRSSSVRGRRRARHRAARGSTTVRTWPRIAASSHRVARVLDRAHVRPHHAVDARVEHLLAIHGSALPLAGCDERRPACQRAALHDLATIEHVLVVAEVRCRTGRAPSRRPRRHRRHRRWPGHCRRPPART